jgi:excisionase family DNA binding protein
MVKPLTEEDRLVKPSEAATLLALSRRTLRRYEASGRLPAVKLNRRVTRYRVPDLRRLMEVEVAR